MRVQVVWLQGLVSESGKREDVHHVKALVPCDGEGGGGRPPAFGEKL